MGIPFGFPLGPRINCLWIPHGSPIDSLLFPWLPLGSPWVPYGLPTISLRAPMDSLWISSGASYGSCMDSHTLGHPFMEPSRRGSAGWKRQAAQAERVLTDGVDHIMAYPPKALPHLNCNDQAVDPPGRTCTRSLHHQRVILKSDGVLAK